MFVLKVYLSKRSGSHFQTHLTLPLGLGSKGMTFCIRNKYIMVHNNNLSRLHLFGEGASQVQIEWAGI